MSEMSLHDVVESASQRSHRRQRRANEKRRRRRRRRTFMIIVLSLLIVGGALSSAWNGLKPIVASLTEPDDWTGDEGTGQVVVQIKPGTSGGGMGTVLTEAGVVKTAKAFASVYSDDARAQSIQPGTYRLHRHMSAKAALELLLDPKAKLTIKVTIPEGRRLGQILDLIIKETGLSRQALDAAAEDTTRIGLPPEAKGNLEGYLYPATYMFGPGTTASEVLTEMISHGQATMNQLGVSPDDQRTVLIKASLVQAEAGRGEDMPKIATVMDNRLAKGMKLELDTTVHYATGTFTLTTTEEDTRVNSPYNTYLVPGLPVAPIDSPGVEAIKAVVSPTPGPWLYFTTVNPDTGETEFATTLAEKAVMDTKFRAWQKAHPGQ